MLTASQNARLQSFVRQFCCYWGCGWCNFLARNAMIRANKHPTHTPIRLYIYTIRIHICISIFNLYGKFTNEKYSQHKFDIPRIKSINTIYQISNEKRNGSFVCLNSPKQLLKIQLIGLEWKKLVWRLVFWVINSCNINISARFEIVRETDCMKMRLLHAYFITKDQVIE